MTANKILCPVDFSAGSQQALRVAVRLAKQRDAELVIVHSCYVPPAAFAGEFPFPATVLQELSDDAETRLAAAVREATEMGAKRVSSKLLDGAPWYAIVDTLEDRAFDLVVIGTHGRTGLSRVLLGSVAEKVVRHAPCSVLAVRPAPEARPFSHILCAIDFSESSQQAIGWTKQLMWHDKARVTLLHVVELPITYYEEPIAMERPSALEKRAERELQTIAGELTSVTLTSAHTRICVGRPGQETLEILDADRTIDLVVLGSHGRTGIRRALMGSVAEKVVRHASCAVLVARKRS